MLRIELKRSYIGVPEQQKKVLRALGLRKIRGFVMKKDNKAIQGMISKVPHLISVKKIDE